MRRVVLLYLAVFGFFLAGIFLWVDSLASTQQIVSITVNQSLFLNCSGSTVSFSVTQSDIQGTQPFQIGTWSCTVDALTKYRLNSRLATATTNVGNASPSDFTASCTSATGGNPGANAPRCAVDSSLSGFDPDTRRGTGGNTAGTAGAVFSGAIFVNAINWHVGMLPGSYTGVITYSVTDTTP
jgi:hypothetical protein